MSWFRKKREKVTFPQFTEEALFIIFREANSRLMSHLSDFSDEILEELAQRYVPYIAVLMRYMLDDMVARRKELDVDSAWETGLKEALMRRSKTQEDYSRNLSKCSEAIKTYAQAYDQHKIRFAGPPTNKYFSACEHFSDLVLPITSPDRRNVFGFGKEIHELTAQVCGLLAKQCDVIGN